MAGKPSQWDSELAGAGRLLLNNEENFGTLQHVFLDPVLDTLLENLQSKEEAIIGKISKKMEAIAKKSGGSICIPLKTQAWQRELFVHTLDLKIDRYPIDLELALTRIHKLVFAKGKGEKAELADFVLHVQYVAPHNRYVGLSNFFQMKRITDEACRAAIDLRQIRFWACPSKMSYWDWDPKNTVNVSDYYRHGQCSYYWFAHSSKEAHNALADGLLANARSWMSNESRHSIHWGWLHPLLFMRILASMTPPLQLDPIHLVSSCASCASVKEAIRVQRSTRICTARAFSSKNKTIHLMNDAKKLVIPLYPSGLRFLDCVFLHHGVDSGLLSKVLRIAKGLGPAKRAEKSGLAIVLTVRLGGQDVRNEREIQLA